MSSDANKDLERGSPGCRILGAGAGEGRGPHAPARQPHGHNLLSGQAAGKSQIKTTTQNNQILWATMSF